SKGKTKFEKLGGALLFPVSVRGGETIVLTIEEWTPVKKSIDINQGEGIKAIGLYLKSARLDVALKSGLQEVVRRHTEGADLEQRVELLEEQMGVYRTRIDEINFQLVTLNKVPQADRLKRHLTEKMEEISDKLQAATMEVSELKGRLMTARIELQDKLAELTLSKPGQPEKHARKE
ncbi:MAG TPA: hypothetical protein VFB62_24265, partial [Polyangiaceae bacterium]|nr:hypothetical protein [Polyangiaceae bacterium]